MICWHTKSYCFASEPSHEEGRKAVRARFLTDILMLLLRSSVLLLCIKIKRTCSAALQSDNNVSSFALGGAKARERAAAALRYKKEDKELKHPSNSVSLRLLLTAERATLVEWQAPVAGALRRCAAWEKDTFTLLVFFSDSGSLLVSF